MQLLVTLHWEDVWMDGCLRSLDTIPVLALEAYRPGIVLGCQPGKLKREKRKENRVLVLDFVQDYQRNLAHTCDAE